MSDSNIFKDFYQVPNVTFNISKLRDDLKKFLKGQTLHGFGAHVVDAKKEINYPDDINDKVYSAKFRAFIRKNNLNYAPIFLCSTNLYYSNLVNLNFIQFLLVVISFSSLIYSFLNSQFINRVTRLYIDDQIDVDEAIDMINKSLAKFK